MQTRASNRLRHVLRLAWIAGIAVVVTGSLLPGDSLPIRELGLLNISDKIQHFAAYAALAFLPALHERRKFVIVAAVALAALGVLLEFGQLLSEGRDFEIGDMLADAGGVCAGLACGWLLRGYFASWLCFLPNGK